MHKILVSVLLLVPSLVLAQPATKPVGGELVKPVRPRPESVVIQEITEQLASTDPAARKAALDEIRTRMQRRGLSDLRQYWLKHLQAAKLNQEIADLTLEGILLYPQETSSVEAALHARIKALIQLGRGAEALGASKSLFNVSRMTFTSEAILAVAEAINAAQPENVAMFNTFREEQMAGAAVTPATQPAQPAPRVICTVLASIKIDAKPYEEALRKMSGEDATSLMARGNLLLLADRPKEARVIFDRMYSLAGSDLVDSSEAIARSIKAEDGTIARANAWVLSIRRK